MEYEAQPNVGAEQADFEQPAVGGAEAQAAYAGEAAGQPYARSGEPQGAERSGAQTDETAPAAEQQEPVASEPVAAPEPEQEESSVPAWFAAAQRKAKKPKTTGPARRSRYADALDAAVAESSVHFEEANKVLQDEQDQQRRVHSRDIVEVEPPASGEEVQPAPEAAPAAEVAGQSEEPVHDFSVLPGQERQGHPRGEEAPADASSSNPDATTAMPPIDVSSLRASRAAEGNPEVARLQKQPSRTIEPAQRRTGDRIVIDETGSVPQVSEESEWVSERQAESTSEASPPLPCVTLPDVEGEGEELPSLDDLKQRAPLADAVEADPGAKPSLSSRIPRIELSDSGQPNQEADNKRAALRMSLPSLSGAIPTGGERKQENQAVSLTGSFAAVGAEGTFAPVGDELVADIAPEERYVEDADDSSFEENVTNTGAYAGPGYMEMPEKHRGLFGRLRRRKKNKNAPEQSTASWLGVEEDFSAPEVGAARGSWESFQNESQDFNGRGEYYDEGYSEYYDEGQDYEDPGQTQRWNGGAFSRLRDTIRPSGEAGEEPLPEEYGEPMPGEQGEPMLEGDAGEFEQPTEEERPRTRRGAQPLSPEFTAIADLAAAKAAQDGVQEQIAAETKQIFDFRSNGIATEIWFVALGSERAGNGGMKAFLAEHGSDLRGSVVVNLESLGAGELGVTEEEGTLMPRKPSSRVKRFVRAASQATGISPQVTTMNWRDSAAAVAMRYGLQAMTIAGMEGGKPAFYGQGDDVLEAIDEGLLEENIAFVYSMLQNI